MNGPTIVYDTSYSGLYYAYTGGGGYTIEPHFRDIVIAPSQQISQYDVTQAVQIVFDVRTFNEKIGLFKDASNVEIVDTSYNYTTNTFPIDSLTVSSVDFLLGTSKEQILSVGQYRTLYSDFITFVNNYFAYPGGFSSMFSVQSTIDLSNGIFDAQTFINIMNSRGFDMSNNYVNALSGAIDVSYINTSLQFACSNNTFDNRSSGITVGDGYIAGDLVFIPYGTQITLFVRIRSNDASFNTITATPAGMNNISVISGDYSSGYYSQTTTVSTDYIRRVVRVPLLLRLDNLSSIQLNVETSQIVMNFSFSFSGITNPSTDANGNFILVAADEAALLSTLASIMNVLISDLQIVSYIITVSTQRERDLHMAMKNQSPAVRYRAFVLSRDMASVYDLALNVAVNSTLGNYPQYSSAQAFVQTVENNVAISIGNSEAIPVLQTNATTEGSVIFSTTSELTYTLSSYEILIPDYSARYIGNTGPTGHSGWYGDDGTMGCTGLAGDYEITGPTGYTGTIGPDGVDCLTGCVGPSVVYSVSGDDGSQGNIGLYGNVGHIGDNGIDGATGSTGAIGYNSEFFYTGNSGITGDSQYGSIGSSCYGVDGQFGENGEMGYTGYTAYTGCTSYTGYNGSTGNQGTTGVYGAVGIAEIHGYDGNANCTGYTGASTYGSDGCAAMSGLPGTHGMSNTAGYDGPAGETVVSDVRGMNGSIGNMGEIGPDGIRGAEGVRDIGITGHMSSTSYTATTGYTGCVGPTASSGNIGINGDVGQYGITGESGFAGNEGETGNSGTIGSYGTDGCVAISGNFGMSGQTGMSGLTSIPGQQGCTGQTNTYAGPTGNTGPTGDDGCVGITGYTSLGYTGAAGDNGEFAATKEAGVSGPTGHASCTGETGASGIPGATGETGLFGCTGYIGVDGLFGATGTPGSSGTIGVSGADGFDGATGATGTAGCIGSVGYGYYAETGATMYSYTTPDLIVATGMTGVYSVYNAGVVGPTGPQISDPGPIGPTGTSGDMGTNGDVGTIGYTGNNRPATGCSGTVGSAGSIGPNSATAGSSDIGTTGPIGYTGVDGIMGPQPTASVMTGHTGEPGTTGTTGSTGCEAEIGSTGNTGPTGFYGATGITGPNAEIGLHGASGIVGCIGDIGISGSSEIVGSFGETGTHGFAGDEGDISIEGTRGNVGAIGSHGTTGVSGMDGVSGTIGNDAHFGDIGDIGDDGIRGIEGIDGITGNTGCYGTFEPNGYDGATAEMGPTGTYGERGDVGVNGTTGTAGTTGTIGNTGDIGFIGTDGAQMDISYEGVIGDRGIQNNNVDSGDDGPTGSTGYIGNTGNDGPIGYTGIVWQGNTGITGPVGYEGTVGKPGEYGNTGQLGDSMCVQGNMGESGITGETGITGDLGEMGPIGVFGVPGNIGTTGTIGVSGTTGTDACTGNSGVSGTTGNRGIIGIRGEMGATGAEGEIGLVGCTGHTSTTGPTGTEGTIGIRATVGVSGVSGYSGISGATGTDGQRGNSNQIGEIGAVGWEGYAGATGYRGIATDIIPETMLVADTENIDRQVFSKPVSSLVYISDNPMHTTATIHGSNNGTTLTYTFGKGREPKYMSLVGDPMVGIYGTNISKDTAHWSPISYLISGTPEHIIWDGLVWISSRNAESDILYGYNDMEQIDSNATLMDIQYNGQMYVGIGTGGIFFSYDGIHWINSTSGTSVLNNTSSMFGKILWNGYLWIAGGQGSQYTMAYSYDGYTWTGVAGSKTWFDASGGVVDVVWTGTVFVAAGTSTTGSILATSMDGITWTSANVFLSDVLPPASISVSQIANTSVVVSYGASPSANVVLYTLTVVGGGQTARYTPAASPFILTGLTNTTLYTLSLTASDANGTSTPITTSFTTINFPDPPSELSVVETATNTISIAYTPPSQPVDTYNIIAVSNTNGSSVSNTVAGTINAHTITGLNSENYYTVYVSAQNTYGTSASEQVDATTSSLPDTPSNVLVQSINNTSAVISFTAPTQLVLYYTLSITPTAGGTTTTNTYTEGSPLTVNGLSFGTAYTFVLSATNSSGTSPTSTVSGTTTSFPDIPEEFIITAVSNTTISVQFTPPAQTITTYMLTAVPTSGTTVSQTFDGSFSEYTITELTAYTEYTVGLTATNSYGTSSATYAPATTIASPSIPTNLSISDTSASSISISFGTPSVGPITSYAVSATDANNNVISQTFDANLTSYTITGLTKNTNYTIRLNAVNVYGNSPTASISATTKNPPDTPTNLASTAITSSAITISFSAPTQTVSTYSVSAVPSSGSTVSASFSGTTAYTITGLVSSTFYTVNLSATNADGTSGTATITATTSIYIPVADASFSTIVLSGGSNYTTGDGYLYAFTGSTTRLIDNGAYLYLPNLTNTTFSSQSLTVYLRLKPTSTHSRAVFFKGMPSQSNAVDANSVQLGRTSTTNAVFKSLITGVNQLPTIPSPLLSNFSASTIYDVFMVYRYTTSTTGTFDIHVFTPGNTTPVVHATDNTYNPSTYASVDTYWSIGLYDSENTSTMVLYKFGIYSSALNTDTINAIVNIA